MTDIRDELENPSPSTSSLHQGGCHCGAVRFQVILRPQAKLEDSRPVAIACNCSICNKKGFLHYIVPPEDFSLLQGQASLTEYRFNTQTAQHLFCQHCGIHAFYRPRSHPNHWDINLNCLDQATDPEFLTQFQIHHFNGQAWEDNIQTLRQEANVANTDSANALQ